MTKHTTREAWLNDVAGHMAAWFGALDYEMPKVRMSVGFPSSGRRSKAIGECWSDKVSGDETYEIFITPLIDDAMRVADILAHELIHAVVGLEAKHGPKFRKVALAIGLQGKMTATTAGPEFVEAAQPILDAVGPLPHAKLDAVASTAPKKQSTRLVKVVCAESGYTVRTTRKWLDELGAPISPVTGEAMQEAA